MKITPELETYIATNKSDQDFKLLLETIRKGNWSYNEAALEGEYGALCWIIKNRESSKWNMLLKLKWVGFVFIALAVIGSIIGGREVSGLEVFFLLMAVQSPNFVVSAILFRAKKFLAHTHRLDPGFKTVQASSSADEISKLHKLKQDGILSEDEFQTAKRKLVG